MTTTVYQTAILSVLWTVFCGETFANERERNLNAVKFHPFPNNPFLNPPIKGNDVNSGAFITLPPPSDQSHSTCVIDENSIGVCTLLVQCVVFYDDILSLQQEPCTLSSGETGVCCPLVFHQVAAPTRVVQQENVPVFSAPKISHQELNQFCDKGLSNFQIRRSFAEGLVKNNIVLEKESPSQYHQSLLIATSRAYSFGVKALKNLAASKEMRASLRLDPNGVGPSLSKLSSLGTVLSETCREEPICTFGKYRTMDGTCNNEGKKNWGAAYNPFQRILPPAYADGIDSPRMGVDNEVLPSARVLSKLIAKNTNDPYQNFTLMLMQWGQFLDHDLTFTPLERGENNTPIKCCNNGKLLDPSMSHPACFPIKVPETDLFYGQYGVECMEFVRSMPAPRDDCSFGPREQMNQITSFLDGSNVYGSDSIMTTRLREFRGGRLKTIQIGGQNMLPLNEGDVHDECTNAEQQKYCFRAGDTRVNEQPHLTVMHTIWVREHNRVAGLLAQLNPVWNDEVLFQETRRIIVAKMQHITFKEFLPVVLGREYTSTRNLLPQGIGHTYLYNASLNPTITNAFAAAAFRFGHTLIDGNLMLVGLFGQINKELILHENQFNTSALQNSDSFDALLRGLSLQSAQKFDTAFTNEITEHLFQKEKPWGLDLVALNIQRGRDHGLPPYNEWREVCGLGKVNSFDELINEIPDDVIQKMNVMYRNVDDIDLFIGGISEEPLEGAIVGPTFMCIIGDTFVRIRNGDRFYYEEGNQIASFSEVQLQEIRKASLARIICDNTRTVQQIQPRVFFKASYWNERLPCSSDSIPRVNLSPWRNEPTS